MAISYGNDFGVLKEMLKLTLFDCIFFAYDINYPIGLGL